MTSQIFSFDNGNITTYPLPGILADPTPVLQLADPVVYAIATFFTEILNTNLSPRFQDECRAVGLTHANFDNWIDGYAVAQTIVFPLNSCLLQSTNFRFPLLAIQPIKEEYHQWTLTNLSTCREFEIAWILPPLSPAQMNRIYPFFKVASNALLAYGTQGYDPKVNPDGPSFWQTAGLSFGRMYGATYIDYDGFDINKKEVFFPSIQLSLDFVERNQQPVPQPNQEDFTSVYLQENIISQENPANPIDNFIDGYVVPNITITSCTPSSGTIQGNTLLIIQGTGFNSATLTYLSQLNICGVPVQQLVVKSPTVIMAITSPAVIGVVSQLGDVIITDTAGNTYDLINSFTYTSP